MSAEIVFCRETGKIRYPSRGEAEKTLLCISKQHRSKAGVAYRCPWCNDWHVSHANRKPVVRRMQEARNG